MGLPLDRTALLRYVERSIQDLPPLPSAIGKILEVTDRSDATSSELDRLISTEPAVTAKLLKVVNSAYYGLPRQVSSTSHAILVLGFHQIRNLVLAMAALSLLKSTSTSDSRLQLAIWKHSLAAAAASEWIASDRALPSEHRGVAYVSSLLHDIGALLLLSSFTDLYKAAMKAALEQGGPMEQAERQLFGIDHAEVGGMLASAWRFPLAICSAIGSHHSHFTPHEDPVAAVVSASDFAASNCGCSVVPTSGVHLDPELALWCGFTDGIPEALAAHVGNRVLVAEGLFEIL